MILFDHEKDHRDEHARSGKEFFSRLISHISEHMDLRFTQNKDNLPGLVVEVFEQIISINLEKVNFLLKIVYLDFFVRHLFYFFMVYLFHIIKCQKIVRSHYVYFYEKCGLKPTFF